MTKAQILEISRDHISNLNLMNSQADRMSLISSEPVITSVGYYFEYRFELKNPDEHLAIGGAPGFVINQKSGDLKVLSWAELNDLKIN